MKKTTEQLLHDIQRSHDLQEVLAQTVDESLNETAAAYLNRLLAQKHLSPAEVARRSGQGEYVYKVFSGSRRPSRDILLAIALGLTMDVRETQRLLRLAGTAQLDPRVQRDAVILYALHKNLPPLQLNEYLYDLGMPSI